MNQVSIVLDDGFSPIRSQAIHNLNQCWIIVNIGPLGTNFSEIACENIIWEMRNWGGGGGGGGGDEEGS